MHNIVSQASGSALALSLAASFTHTLRVRHLQSVITALAQRGVRRKRKVAFGEPAL